MDPERVRLEETRRRQKNWKRWGPYLSERQWGTVREDYSEGGAAWDYFPHDHARSRAYRWGEDGIAGFSDRHQYICFALALWNGRDPILKERLFGLAGGEGNHGEDVKECYFYLDSTPTHSYMKFLYKYPQSEFPYARLVEENRRRGRNAPELELIDTGVFDENRYFDVIVEYAKATPEDVLICVEAVNRGRGRATLHLIPTLWFRNTWAWGLDARQPRLKRLDVNAIELEHFYYDRRFFFCEGTPHLLFTENETNLERLYGVPNTSPYVKDGIHDFIVRGREGAVNPEGHGTKLGAHYVLALEPGAAERLKFRLSDQRHGAAFGRGFDELVATRRAESDLFYATVISDKLSEDARNVMRQAFAGLLWSKQFYHYEVARWLRGDPAGPEPPKARASGRNHEWTHLYNADVLSMPDKWEYPWYAAWDLAFHAVPLALVDPDFAKEQLVLLTREWYMHPNGQLPAYEWALSDVNPPVHAWAALRVYEIDKRVTGVADRRFLARVFHKLLLNFTWWVNRKDAGGANVFEGGFMGLDNVGPFDRSARLPEGVTLQQSDATSWMAMYCLNLMSIALELALEDPSYEDVASKFFEHFVYIARAMNNMGGRGIELWDRADGFFYDVLGILDGRHVPLRVRSIVGLIPLFAVTTLSSNTVDRLPGFKRRLQWFVENRAELSELLETRTNDRMEVERFLALVHGEKLARVLERLLSEGEFLSPYGVRSLSRYHREHPYAFGWSGVENVVRYEPAESESGLFGGNSNWRGPIWFPLNYLLIESLRALHAYLGDDFKVRCPTESERRLSLLEAADEIARRLVRLFLRDADGRRPLNGGVEMLDHDPYFRDLVLFYEYFHGDDGRGLGASHQTGWTALVTLLLTGARGRSSVPVER